MVGEWVVEGYFITSCDILSNEVKNFTPQLYEDGEMVRDFSFSYEVLAKQKENKIIYHYYQGPFCL